MGSTAFGLLIAPLFVRLTLIFLAMAAVQTLMNAVGRISRRPHRAIRPAGRPARTTAPGSPLRGGTLDPARTLVDQITQSWGAVLPASWAMVV